MYARGSPRSSKQDLVGASGGVQSPSPTKSCSSGRVTPVSVSHTHSHNAVLSPNRTHRRGSNQGSRSGSPLTLSMDSVNVAHLSNFSGHGQSYLSESLHSGSPSPSRTPYQSPSHSRSSSLSSVRSILSSRDRPAEKIERDHFQQFQQQLTNLARDRSLDRHMDRQHREGERCAQPQAGRDRSLDREYPFMGARSLDRDHQQFGLLSRSRSIDQNYLAEQSFLAVHEPGKLNRDALILDLQAQVAELNKQCATYLQELDSTKEKLSSNMNSIKTFWSPELKKERALRKEECAKYTVLNEQLKIAQAENQKQNRAIQGLEEEMRNLHDCRTNGNSTVDTETLKREKNRQAKEVVILRKTIEEMELRIDSQKQTLNARDESIKKLLEMLKSKGVAVKHLEDDRIEQERMRTKIVEEERRIQQLEGILEQRDLEISTLKEELMKKSLAQANNNHSDSDTTEALQAIIETKDSKVASLERELKCLEDEMLRLREEGAYRDKEDGSMQVESLKSQERILKTKIENLKMELSKKDSELYAIRTKQETLEKQQSDNQQHIIVLRESVAAKERHCTMLQTDIEDLRHRMREKDELIEKKANQILSIQQDKKRIEAEINEIKEHMEIKERKINVLQRKMENLDEVLREKDEQLNSTKSRLASVHADQSSSDTVLSSLEASLAEKDKQIDRLKEKCERDDKEHQEELEHYQSVTRDLKSRLDNLQADADEKQNSILEMREEMADLKCEKKKKESQMNQLEMQLSQKTADLSDLEIKLKKIQMEQSEKSNQQTEEMDATITELKNQMVKEKESVQKTQGEVDRLLDILKEMEDEKHQKDKLIKEAQDQIKDFKQKLGTMKRSHQTEKKKNAHLLEEARKREDAVNDDASQLKNVINQKDERIEDLEEALKESVKITAEREMVMAQQQSQLDNTDKQVEELVLEVERLRKISSEATGKVNSLQKKLEDKETQMSMLQTERKKQLEEVYEMKQEALLAAISEKDAHIALLEMTSTKKQKTTDEVLKIGREKDKLQTQLKQLTQRRMKLLQNEEKNGQNDMSLAKQMQHASTEQVIQAIRRIDHGKKRLATLIDQLVAACLDIDKQLLEGLPRTQLDYNNGLDTLRGLTHQQLLSELKQSEQDSAQLQDYANVLLQRIRDSHPQHLNRIFSLLDSSCSYDQHQFYTFKPDESTSSQQQQHQKQQSSNDSKTSTPVHNRRSDSPKIRFADQPSHIHKGYDELKDSQTSISNKQHNNGRNTPTLDEKQIHSVHPQQQIHHKSAFSRVKEKICLPRSLHNHISSTSKSSKEQQDLDRSHQNSVAGSTNELTDQTSLPKLPQPNGVLKSCLQRSRPENHVRHMVEPT